MHVKLNKLFLKNYLHMLNEINKILPSVEDLTKKEKTQISKTLINMFLDWNGSDAATNADTRSETQEALMKILAIINSSN